MNWQRLLRINKLPNKKEKYFHFNCNSYMYLQRPKLKHKAHAIKNEINNNTKNTNEKTRTKANGQSRELLAWLSSLSPQKSLVKVQDQVTLLCNPFLIDLSHYRTEKSSLSPSYLSHAKRALYHLSHITVDINWPQYVL